MYIEPENIKKKQSKKAKRLVVAEFSDVVERAFRELSNISEAEILDLGLNRYRKIKNKKDPRRV